MSSRYHVVIVGSGVAGMAAADTFAGSGLDILVIDENSHSGGQMLRQACRGKEGLWQFDPALIDVDADSITKKMDRHLKPLTSLPKGMDYVSRAEVIGIFKDRKVLVNLPSGSYCRGKDKKGISEIEADYLILATGARERYLPFKGWTLPGVISLGSAQILMKSSGVLPASSTLIAGTSPLQMVLAGEILKNGGKVSAILDEKRLSEKLALLPLLRNHLPKIREGAEEILKLIIRGVPMHQGVRVVEARGKNGLSSVVTKRVNSSGRSIAGTEKAYPARALATGYGFCPNIELPVQAGCHIGYSPDRGGWAVKVDRKLETSISSIYAAGETTGIAGASKSYVEGRIAASSVLEKFGIRHRYSGYMEKLASGRDKLEKYGAFLNRLCSVTPSAYREIPDDTVICRCEEITMGELKKYVDLGFNTAGGLKKATRCGMGRCQGRICQPVMMDILIALTGRSSDEIGRSITRAPVKNVPINSFLQE